MSKKSHESWLQEAELHLHWLLVGGEFTAWWEKLQETTPMPWAAGKEVDAAMAFLKRLERKNR